MLNRNSRKFLSFLRKSTPDDAGRVYTYDWIEKNYSQPIEAVFATVRYLNKLGYLDIAETDSHIHYGVVLTETALHPYEFTWEEVKSFLIRSILVPIVVSVAASIITTVIALMLSGTIPL